ncbi:hypothetical protein FW781_10970 [Chryseobacterium panacisoli]|uniref:Uncharacterized protein n=1 Tax=Chryseobacterium panacisoli TaxID=1807141 RepID=A0A5D8ZPD5_9FLAO|nr:hypothetical protein [Chryseobacterium panacisoli]TZF95952.1 hypothetical protein FW781_10970 [Chryseobacterium panacisoli]
MKKVIKIKTTVVLTGFEKISESQGKQLLGGFSRTITNPDTGIDDGISNNCQGGNCAINCSIHQNLNCSGACGK